ncbi:ADP-ribosylglycohydrolase family protein [Erythrobacter sp. SG61-1L]|uniref:ADP-ribosylglycohydrolase family protein n=1 Tax=Erythrobacter sp. SG61-1L TaxID=1603897 RepID=UPI0006C93889|nr:ADP-ribosylglycohydrolase family protein [Erythrobacter sp. SG61-1L]
MKHSSTIRLLLASATLTLAAPMPAMAADTAAAQPELRLSKAELEDKIYASWLGQLVGNIYGLPHENVHIDEPGPDAFPYGYDFLEIPYYQSHFGATRMTGVMDAFGGAFSDDDTDFEYIYLRLMEQAGAEPTYAQIRDAWIAHVDNWVWIANRQALAMMHQGFYPPETGAKDLNPEYFQIDPQLINEIWAITAPGMVDYAAQKSRWAAKISADAEGTEPTIAYGAMFSAAFHESDVAKLVDIGQAALPADSQFAKTIAFVKELKHRYPDDWKAARKEVAKAYYENSAHKSIWDANLNGACAILALLYGEGDFRRSLDLASAMGFDADNQAATVAGLLALAGGTKAIPEDLLYPIKGWTLPFNDRYLNRSRRDMPSVSIREMAQRTARLAEQQILDHGGQSEIVDGQIYYRVNQAASFTPPFEIMPSPPRTLIAGQDATIQLYAGGSTPASWTATDLPPGLAIDASGRIGGVPSAIGSFDSKVTVTSGGKSLSETVTLIVKGSNLAQSAVELLGPLDQAGIEPLRDGATMGGTSVESPKGPTRLESFGYRWDKPVDVGSMLVTTGKMGEYGGWFVSLSAEYLDADGNWIAIPGVRMVTEPVLVNDKHLRPQFASYLIEFPKIRTSAVRIKGLNGGEGDQRYISLSELAVFPQ